MVGVEFSIKVPQGAERVTMLGLGDRNLKIIREALGVQVFARGQGASLGRTGRGGRGQGGAGAAGPRRRAPGTPDPPASVGPHQHRGDQPRQRRNGTEEPRRSRWESPARHTRHDDHEEAFGDPLEFGPAWEQHLDVYVGGQAVRAKTANQQAYLDAIRDHDLVFCIGPAGTGKTYLAVAAAASLLKRGQARRSSWSAPPSRPASGSAFFPATCRQRSIRTFARCSMPCTT